jgi:hypothetical protein
VQFSNGVSANTHKGFALEILMKECRVFSFRLEGVEQVVPYVLGSYLVLKREPWNKCMCMEAHWKVFGQ